MDLAEPKNTSEQQDPLSFVPCWEGEPRSHFLMLRSPLHALQWAPGFKPSARGHWLSSLCGYFVFLGLCSSACSPNCLLVVLRPPRGLPYTHSPSHQLWSPQASVHSLSSCSGSYLYTSAALEAAWRSFVPASTCPVVATPHRESLSG